MKALPVETPVEVITAMCKFEKVLDGWLKKVQAQQKITASLPVSAAG